MVPLVRRLQQSFEALRTRAGWQSVQLFGLGGGLLGFIGDFLQPAFEGGPLSSPLGWMVLAGLVIILGAWWALRRLEGVPTKTALARRAARTLLASGTVTAVLLIVLVVNLAVQTPRGLAAEVITPVAQLQAELFGRQLESIGYDVAAIKQSVWRQEETLSRVAESMDLSVAMARLDRAREAQDGSIQGQVEAIEALLGRGHQYSGANLSGVSFLGADLSGGVFEKAVLHAVDLRQVVAERARFSGSGLRFATLEQGDFTGAGFAEAYAPFVVANAALFAEADLSGANFFAGTFQGADFRNANLRGAAFAFADLRESRFEGADLTGAYLTGALLEGAQFDRAVMAETDVSGARFDLSAFSQSQRSGLCQRRYERVVEWRVDLLERWPSDRFSSGYEFEEHYVPRAYFEGFSAADRPLCETPPDRAAGFHAAYPGQISMHLDRSYLGKAGRRTAFVERVGQRLAVLQQAYAAASP